MKKSGFPVLRKLPVKTLVKRICVSYNAKTAISNNVNQSFWGSYTSYNHRLGSPRQARECSMADKTHILTKLLGKALQVK
jgi:hypothetical protein